MSTNDNHNECVGLPLNDNLNEDWIKHTDRCEQRTHPTRVLLALSGAIDVGGPREDGTGPDRLVAHLDNASSILAIAYGRPVRVEQADPGEFYAWLTVAESARTHWHTDMAPMGWPVRACCEVEQ